MAYIDKCFFHDEHDRKIELLNHVDGWKDDWDLDHISLRRRYTESRETSPAISIEVWHHNGDLVELILSRDNAMLLAQRLMMSVAELNVEAVTEYNQKRIEELEHKMDWLQPVIDDEKKKWKDAIK